MNHYDGPAFYRRFLNRAMGKKPFNNQSSKRHIRHKQIHLKKDDIQTSNPIAEMTKAFKPNQNYHYHSQLKVYHHSDHGINYNRLKSELQKNNDSYIVIASNYDNDSTFGQQTNQFSINRSELSNLDEHQNNNDQGSNFDHKTTPISNVSVHETNSDDISNSNNPNDDQKITSKKASENVKPSNRNYGLESSHISSQNNSNNSELQSDVISNSSNQASKSSSSDEDLSESSNYQSSSDNVKSKSASKYGLGNTLSSILNDEDSGDHHSKLFDQDQQKKQNTEQQMNDNQNHGKNLSSEKNTTHLNNERAAEQPSSDTVIGNNSNSNVAHPKVTQINPTDRGYHYPSPKLLNQPKHFKDEHLNEWIKRQAKILNKTLDAFNVDAEVVDWTNGPTVTQFQVKLKLGVKVSKITNLTDDLKLALAAKDIRIEAPIPGRTTVGIEIPNPKPRPVLLSEVINSDKFQNSNKALTVALGVDLTGQPQVTDIRKMPHGLIAGATGSGKSVFINSLLMSLLYKDNPSELRLILIDPKAVELAPYNGIPHLLSPVISDPKQASAALKWAVKEMDQRYERLAAGGVRNIEQFNKEAEKRNEPGLKMPYIVIVIDELADLMMVASTEVEDYIVRITQKARAAGIHLIVATQRPSVDIITGTIKNNIPTRVAFMVSSQVDSRTIIDSSGAERLLGKGDMLYVGSGSSQPIRLQGTFVGNNEIEKVTDFIRQQGHPNYAFQPKSLLKHVDQVENQDKLMPQVLKYISNEKTISTSKLQRVFSIGYNRAASLIDDLEQNNYVSSQHGSKPRDVYLTKEDYQKLNQ